MLHKANYLLCRHLGVSVMEPLGNYVYEKYLYYALKLLVKELLVYSAKA